MKCISNNELRIVRVYSYLASRVNGITYFVAAYVDHHLTLLKRENAHLHLFD